ncbi:MAG: tRNA 2-selenouridine(34) synthase MnmH [Cyanobacteria bacterium]|nr:tRNA 2-selenouridine(34) synthase MnmH [Cyanobacteriota bacterium]MDA1245832.1 tRNA 2-selenouridine(34) synthase MnmH [Cyanobacteriota bacterium]
MPDPNPPQDVEAFLAASGPIVDVRSPGEFEQGHIPGAVSLPLFSDEERAEIGTAYKRQGRQVAVKLGLKSVGLRLPSLAQRLLDLSDAGKTLRLHCWRGGMRSGSVAWLASTLELPVLLLQGGYKTYRRWVLECFETAWPLLVLGGRTGTGKTDLLHALRERGEAIVDLEGLASHRGSSFGGLGLPPQPSTEHYENLLAASLSASAGKAPIWLEAESAQVGRCRIPAGLWRQMSKAPAVEIQRPITERIEQLVAVYGDQGQESLRLATERIARRLGPQRTATALEAIASHDWAAACQQMLDYYDRCYDNELSRRETPLLSSFDLGGLGPDAAAAELLQPAPWWEQVKPGS